MALKLVKSIRFTERWGSINPHFKNNKLVWDFSSRSTPRELRLWKSELTGKIRIVSIGNSEPNTKDILEGGTKSSKDAKLFSPIQYNLDSDITWKYSEYGEDGFIFQYLATQAAILKREKYYNGSTFLPTEWTDSDLNDKTLSEWWGDLISGKTIEFENPSNNTDLKWRKSYGFKPPYFEIIQDPYIEPVEQIDKNKLKLRSFGTDPYFLNNGAQINIEWFDNGNFVGGVDYSNNWQKELDGVYIGKTPLDQISKNVIIWGLSSSFTLAEKITDGNKVDIGFLNRKELNKNIIRKDFKGLYDDDIIKQVVDKWRLVYGNDKLSLTERWDYYGSIKPTLEFISPVLSTIVGSGPSASLITTSASVATSSTGITGATGASASKISGRYIFDVTKNGYLINIDLGELTILEKETVEDPFVVNNFEQTDDYGNPVQLGSEYIEGDFSGIEELYQEPDKSISDEIPDYDPDRDTDYSVTNSPNIPPVKPDSSKLKDIIKYACQSTYYPSGSKKSSGSCARYTFNHANNFIRTLLKKETQGKNNPAGGNANQEGYFKALERIGYKRFDQGTLTKKDLKSILENKSKWNLGDVVCYWGTDQNYKDKGGVRYGHTQMFTNGYHGTSNPWTSDNEGNFNSSFVYNGYKEMTWRFIIFKSPTSTSDGQKKYGVS